jgi:putative nucleotidyltransferase with HDIG domain
LSSEYAELVRPHYGLIRNTVARYGGIGLGFRRLPAAGSTYVGLVIAAGALVLVMAGRQLSATPLGLEWYTLAGLTILSGSAVLRMAGTQVNFSISDVFTLTTTVLLGPAAGAVIVALDGLTISLRLTRRRPLPVSRVLFNATAPALAMWIAGQAFFFASGMDPLLHRAYRLDQIGGWLLVLACGYFVLNTGAIAIAVALHEREPLSVVWRKHFSELWVSYAGGALGAALVVFAIRAEGLVLPVLALPLLLALILHFAYRHATGRVADQLQHLAQVSRLQISTIESLAHAIDAKDCVTHAHIRRVQQDALRLAAAVGVRDDLQLKALEAAALLHDVGKLAVPEHILNKPGRLTPAEYEKMKTHAPVGAEILAEVDFPYPVVPIVRHHHESWDGTGYPDGLRGTDIPIGARILSIVDCFDALTSDRPYRRALTTAQARTILLERRGTMYDPLVIDAFLELVARDEGHTPAAPPSPLAASKPYLAEARTADRGERRADPLSRAFTMGEKLAQAQTLEHIADTLWHAFDGERRRAGLVIYALKSGTDDLEAVCTAGQRRAELGTLTMAVGARLSGWVAATRQPFINGDAALDFSNLSLPLSAATAVPLVSGERLIGVLTFYTEEVDSFDEHDGALLEAVARGLADRVERALSQVLVRT